jgi:hypothetical protein
MMPATDLWQWRQVREDRRRAENDDELITHVSGYENHARSELTNKTDRIGEMGRTNQ